MELGASPWCLRIIRHGLFIPWTQPPPSLIQDAYKLPLKDLAFSNKTVDAWCAAGTVTEVAPAEAAKLKHLAPSFVVHKGMDRLVVDIKKRNVFIDDRKFVYEQLPGLVKQLVPDDHLVSWDFKDAFHHICLLHLPTVYGWHSASAPACFCPTFYRLGSNWHLGRLTS